MAIFSYMHIRKEEKSLLGSNMEDKLEMFKKQKKSRLVASTLSIVPSLGHFYSKSWIRGSLFSIGGLIGFILLVEDEDPTLYGLVVVGAIYDSSKRVKKYNKNLYDTLLSSQRANFRWVIVPKRNGVGIMLSYHF